ncbi:MAG: hypothetical protein DGJ47_001034 [Rickettsiaceae bacterium]
MRITSVLSIIFTLFALAISCQASNHVLNQQKESLVFQAIKQKKWSKAAKMSLQSKNQALQKIVLSQRFLDSSYKENSFIEMSKFLIKNPLWPQRELIQQRAEALLNDKIDPQAIVKFFLLKKPLTSNGHKHYAYAATAVPQKIPTFPRIIKNGWIKGSFNIQEQKKYYQRFKRLLTIKEHRQKIEYLLMQKKINEAKNIFQYIDSDSKRSFNAHIALIQTPDKSNIIMQSLPTKIHTPGIIYQYLFNMRNSNIKSDRVHKLVLSIKDFTRYGDEIWFMQNYIAREYIDKKRYQDAYQAISFNMARTRANKSNAEFLSGWLALENLKKPKLALRHFKNFNKIVSTPISKARGMYWMGRAYDALKDKETAHRVYKRNAANYPYAFYGQMSAIEVGVDKISIPNKGGVKNYKIAPNSKILTDKSQIFSSTLLVSKYGKNSLAQTYIKQVAKLIKNQQEAKDFLSLLKRNENVHHVNWYAKHILHKHIMLKSSNYPLAYKKQKRAIEASLAYSIVKQESSFYKGAISSANAKGLMQLLDETAHDVANELGIEYFKNKLLKDEAYNMKLGSAYLGQMLERFDGSYVLAIASYNAGPHRVDEWIERFGDPRKYHNYRSVINWIETIPYYETRNYVQRVLENFQVYKSILFPNNKFRMKHDLLGR